MTDINKKIENYLTYFEYRTNNDGSQFVTLKDNAPEELRASIKNAHLELLPDDWIYNMYHLILASIHDYGVSSIDEIEENRYEIIEYLVDCYTSELTAWLNSNVSYVNYLTQALQEGVEVKDGFQALQLAQYFAIKDIFDEVINLLQK
jgi:hypothetical protein